MTDKASEEVLEILRDKFGIDFISNESYYIEIRVHLNPKANGDLVSENAEILKDLVHDALEDDLSDLKDVVTDVTYEVVREVKGNY